MSYRRGLFWSLDKKAPGMFENPSGGYVKRADYLALEAKLDAVMLEYCPDEMTEEQKANWAAHQAVAPSQEPST